MTEDQYRRAQILRRIQQAADSIRNETFEEASDVTVIAIRGQLAAIQRYVDALEAAK